MLSLEILPRTAASATAVSAIGRATFCTLPADGATKPCADREERATVMAAKAACPTLLEQTFPADMGDDIDPLTGEVLDAEVVS